MLFLIIVKAWTCRARSAVKACLSALVTASTRGTDVSAQGVVADAAGRDVAECMASYTCVCRWIVPCGGSGFSWQQRLLRVQLQSPRLRSINVRWRS